MSLIEKHDSPPNLTRCSWIKSGRWFHIPDAEPYLVLYTFADRSFPPGHFPTPSKPPRFREPTKWVNIFHQTAGYACHHLHLFARFLKPRRKVAPLLRTLASKYEDSLLSPVVPLTAAIEYNGLLASYGLGANHDYTLLQEAFYPIDIDFLGKVTAEKFPADLQELIVPAPKHRRGWSFLDRKTFGLAVLGPNCD
jgi:hypothetical protein